MRLVRQSILFVLACGITMFATSTASAAEPKTFIGPIAGGPEDARIALVADGDSITAYVCSGDDAFNQSFSEWFTGDVQDGLVSLQTDDVKLVARLTGDVMDGRIKVGDKSLKFSADALPEASASGLFRAEVPLAESEGEGQIVCGWIVDKEGGYVGAAQILKKAGKQIVKSVVTLAANKIKTVATKVKAVAGVVKNVASAVEDVAGLLAGDATPAVVKAGGAKGSNPKPTKVARPLRAIKKKN